MIWLSYSLLAVSGTIWGFRERSHQNPKVFELLFGVGEESFFGSQMWERKYKDWDAGDRTPKNFLLSILPYNDFWHSSWYVSKSLLIIGCFTLTKADSFFDFKIWSGFLIATIVTMFWGGFSYWVIGKLLKRKDTKERQDG